jgi:hypothetical protein
MKADRGTTREREVFFRVGKLGAGKLEPEEQGTGTDDPERDKSVRRLSGSPAGLSVLDEMHARSTQPDHSVDAEAFRERGE